MPTSFKYSIEFSKRVMAALNKGNITSIVLVAISCYFFIDYMLPEIMIMNFFDPISFTSMDVFYATLVGLVVGGLISSVTEYYTGLGKSPILKIVQQSSTGAATNIIAGLATGMKSTFSSVILFALAIWGSYTLGGFYGVAIAASAMMATTAMQLAIDAFGPISDNAGGVAEMSELPKEVRERTDILDSVGNTTAAIGKGFAIGAAALAALAIISAYSEQIYSKYGDAFSLSITNPMVLVGMFIGICIPFLISSITMKAVGDAAFEMINEIRRQFKEIPGLLEGNSEPDTAKCVDIATAAALKKMLLPGVIAVSAPPLVGLGIGAEALGGMLAGGLLVCVLMALFMANAGGAWDNAKKYIEKGNLGGKGTDTHSAAVVGDTVGDPFKDTSGPSMNILINVMAIVSLVIAPLL